MPPELTLEGLASTLDDIQKTANDMKVDMKKFKDVVPNGAQTEEEKEKEAKKAQEKEEEEKKEALKARRSRRDAALKAAQDETDEDKKDAAIKAAQDEYNDKEHKGQNDDDDEKKDAQTEEEKEEHAAVASILKEKKSDYINKILTANKIFNPSEVKTIEKRLKKANISELEKEWTAVKPFVAGMPNAPEQKPPEQFIPYFASMASPEEIDASQLNANSPDSQFAKLSTKELLEMGQ